ncbi:MAG: hypothetical protein JOS17DRAFT_764295 [Linnemannia elongata]|nr:MAG: hypothetical protein JOS17DRAFT_764295 [Linnemannia elongata]
MGCTHLMGQDKRVRKKEGVDTRTEAQKKKKLVSAFSHFFLLLPFGELFSSQKHHLLCRLSSHPSPFSLPYATILLFLFCSFGSIHSPSVYLIQFFLIVVSLPSCMPLFFFWPFILHTPLAFWISCFLVQLLSLYPLSFAAALCLAAAAKLQHTGRCTNRSMREIRFVHRSHPSHPHLS